MHDAWKWKQFYAMDIHYAIISNSKFDSKFFYLMISKNI